MELNRKHFSAKGKTAEGLAYQLATKSFFVDWCFLNPKFSDGRELCDLLVIFDDIALIWQIKDLKLDENGRYNRSELDKNLRQLAGAKRRLFDMQVPITLSNARRTPETLDPASIKQIFLFSLLMGEGEDYHSTIEHIKSLDVHVVTREFLEIILNELDTISDFCAYCAEKQRVLTQPSLGAFIVGGGEEELLAYYVRNGRTFSDFDGLSNVFIEDGMWSGLQEDPRYLAKTKADAISYGWDDLINRSHTTGSSNYEQIARELARPNRFQRRFLSSALYEAMVFAHKDIDHELYRRVVPSINGRTYCFLFAADDRDPSFRRKALSDFCFVARGKFPETSIVIGIATEKTIRETCSYDFLLLDLPEWGPNQQEIMVAIQEDSGILTGPVHKPVTMDEFPKISE
jgi:hypothetical protein